MNIGRYIISIPISLLHDLTHVNKFAKICIIFIILVRYNKVFNCILRIIMVFRDQISNIMGFSILILKCFNKSNKFRSLDQDSIWLPQMFHHKVSLIHNHNSSGKLFRSFHYNHELLETT